MTRAIKIAAPAIMGLGATGFAYKHDEFNTQMRETARFQATQSLDAIARMFRNPPG
jgi:hypothetical protein